MKNLKLILIKGSAICMLMALVTLNINVNFFSQVSWETIGITMETQVVHAQYEHEYNMDIHECPTGHLVFRCLTDGIGCEVEEQDLCPGTEPEPGKG